jgi:predicted nuclease of predicted toxin-antitoxin system
MSQLRFFIDHCVPMSIAWYLRDLGHDVFLLRECIPKDSPDPVVIQTVQEYHAILVSLNGDFADIITYPPEQYRGIIGIQLRNHPELIPQVLQRLRGYLTEHPSMEDYAGKLLLVEAHRIRIRGSISAE